MKGRWRCVPGIHVAPEGCYVTSGVLELAANRYHKDHQFCASHNGEDLRVEVRVSNPCHLARHAALFSSLASGGVHILAQYWALNSSVSGDDRT